MVSQCPRCAVGRGVDNEFVLLVRCPEVMVGGDVIIDLNCRLIVFRYEDGFVVADYLADPDVVVVVGVFDSLNCHLFLFSRIPLLLHDGGQAVAVVPRVQFAVRGIGFADTVAPYVVHMVKDSFDR